MAQILLFLFQYKFLFFSKFYVPVLKLNIFIKWSYKIVISLTNSPLPYFFLSINNHIQFFQSQHFKKRLWYHLITCLLILITGLVFSEKTPITEDENQASFPLLLLHTSLFLIVLSSQYSYIIASNRSKFNTSIYRTMQTIFSSALCNELWLYLLDNSLS